jgi:signal transduction histidine kinase
MAMTPKRWIIIFAVAMAALTESSRGQSATHWSSYKIADGLPDPTIDSISFTPRGNLIASALNAPLASELDGYSVSNFPAPVGNIGRFYESPGGQRWVLVPGGLAEFKKGSWLRHPVREIAAAARPGVLPPGIPLPLLPVRQGCVLFLLPERLLEYSTENPDEPQTIPIRAAAQTRIGWFTGMAAARNGGLWISGTHGLARVTGPMRSLGPETGWLEYVAPDSLQNFNLSQPSPDDDGGVTLMAESAIQHQKLVVWFDGDNWVTRPAATRNFFRAWRGANRTFWAATRESLFQWDEERTNWIENDENPVGRIFDVAVEPGGAFWLATSDGLIRGAAALWLKPPPVRDLDSAIQCLTVDSEDRVNFVTENKLHILTNESHEEFALPPPLQNLEAIRALFPLKDGSLLVDSGTAPLQFKAGDAFCKALPARDDMKDIIPLGILPTGDACLYHPGEKVFFDDFDGTQSRPLDNAPPAGESKTGLTTLYSARNGDVWIGGAQGALWRHDGQWQFFASGDHTAPAPAVRFAETRDGKVWCATPDELWEFDGKNWLLLQTKFNDINALLQSRDGSIWLASKGGLFRYYDGTWLDYGAEEGLPNGPVRAICEDQRGQLWAATAHGLAGFYAGSDSGPPKTFVRQLAGASSRLSEGDTLNLLLDGLDKWKFTPPGRLLYSYQLDQHGWSVFGELAALSFPNLAAGRHYLQVRAMDRAGNVESAPATQVFTASVPWFREVRLWAALAAGLMAAIFFAAVAWNRHRQLVLSHAAVERKVAERTRELEIATRELLHSQKMNALGTLAAGIAHDFNNILSIIKGSAQIIEDNTDKPEKIRTRVDRIKTVVQQGAEIVDAMLGFSRGSDEPAASCDINTVVTSTMKLLGDRFLREVEVKFERVEHLPEIVARREFIQQILLNFIFNAADAMNGRKEITLATRVVNKLPPDMFLAPTLSDSFVLISVSDRGSGIAPEIKMRIFEPFFTTKALSARRGTGLGLSMAYELAKKMGAGLSVQSAAGLGSTFTLVLPVVRQPIAQPGPQISQ